MAMHTPGPWEAIPPGKKGKHWKVGAHGALGGMSAMAGATVLWNLAMIDNGAPGDTLDTEEANAHLIAAAPDLLAALREFVAIDARNYNPSPGTWDAAVVMARAAIAKAEGK